MSAVPQVGNMELRLRTDDFYSLAEKLSKWKLDPSIRLMKKGKILGFIQGLRLSAELAYIVRKIVSPYPLEVSWGHLVDETGMSCSPECDIIIHRHGFIQQWNGSNEPIMNFKFIRSGNAIAVISCKSFIRSVDKSYCNDLVRYDIKNTLLFAECCTSGSVDRIKAQAEKAGYKGFFYLYTIKGSRSIITQDEKNYIQFIQTVTEIAK